MAGSFWKAARCPNPEENIVDPVKLIERYGVDALKYFLLREYTFGQDGLYTNEVMLNRMNFDLANDLGNLVSRTVAMIEKYNGGTLPQAKGEGEFDADLEAVALGAAKKVEANMDKFSFSQALRKSGSLSEGPINILMRPCLGYWRKTNLQRTVLIPYCITLRKRSESYRS